MADKTKQTFLTEVYRMEKEEKDKITCEIKTTFQGNHRKTHSNENLIKII